MWLVDPARSLVALQKRSPNKDTFPGRWDISAAGHIESGDESRPTAVRELAEELGVICAEGDLDFLGTVPAEQADLGDATASRTCTCCGATRVHRVRGGRGGGERGRLDARRGVGGETRGERSEVVPRTQAYRDAFFRHLRDAGHGCVGDTRRSEHVTRSRRILRLSTS